MFMKLLREKRYYFPVGGMLVLILILLLAAQGLSLSHMFSDKANNNGVNSLVNSKPLLLGSGLCNTNQAEITITVWFETGGIPEQILREIPKQDWQWERKTLKAGSNKIAETMSGSTTVNRQGEIKVAQWYSNFDRKVEQLGGQLYFDERVHQGMDISAYLSANKAIPLQSAFSGFTQSIAAYQEGAGRGVEAGQDKVNIQLLTRSIQGHGETVLAMPALLQEF